MIRARTGILTTALHLPGTSDVKVADARISREANLFDSLTFTMYPDSPGWDTLREFATTVEVVRTRDARVVFDGRVIKIEPDMDSDGLAYKAVTCESVMGYLCDSLQMWEAEAHYADEGGKSGLTTYVEKLLTRHNAAVEEHKRIHPGTITLQTFETSGGVTKGVDRASTWDNIKSKLLDVFGGEMRVRRADDGLLYLDYAERLGTTRATRIELARNMKSASQSVDPSGVITRLYPYGCKLTETVQDEEGNDVEQETERRLTIESVNDGLAYIDDEVAMEQFGIVEGYHEWDDVTTASALLQKGMAWLGQNNALPVSHTMSALDLSDVGLDYDSFELFDSYQCLNPLIGVDETLEIVRQTIDISSPEASTFDMGEVSRRLSSDLTGTATKGDVEVVKSQTHTSIVNMGNELRKDFASIVIDTDSIVSQVSEQVEQNISLEIDSVSGTVTNVNERVTKLEQDASGWEFNFSQISEQISNVEGDVSTKYEEIQKYIRFEDGVIKIGIEGNPLEVHISNDRLSFLQQNVEVAYVSDNQLYITDAEVENSLRLGMFKFVPRGNGNLTLKYIG